ncbi:hypothetical protein E3J79_02500 [Candidatus Dependentiae bacterium]|nr:MAG: hypothetical protein E3J79_02500 [Candidatus Dependentiae bacterium]
MYLHSIKKCFLFFILYFCNQIQSVLVQSEKLTCNNFNGGAKEFYFFYNVHKRPHLLDDSKQLSIMKSIFDEREQLEKSRLHILLEQPPSVVKIFDRTPAVTTDLADCIKKMRNTTVENAEIRCVASAATFLFNPEIDPFEIFPRVVFDTAQKECVVDDVTVADLISEYCDYKKQIEQFRNNTIPLKVRQVIDKEVDSLEKEYKALENEIKIQKLELSENLLAIAKRLKEVERSRLFTLVINTFGHLFELHLFKRMIELDVSKIALIAGALHTIFVKQMLEEAGARALIFHTSGFDLSCNNVVPLEPKYLDIFTEPAWYERCTVL